MHNITDITSLTDYIIDQNRSQGIHMTKTQAINQLISIFEQHNEWIPLFAEIYNQHWFQQWPYHKRDVLWHTKQTLIAYRQNRELLSKSIPWLLPYIQHTIDTHTIDTLIQLSLVYHDAGKKIMKETTWYMRWHAAYTITHQWPHIATKYQLTPKEYAFTKILIEHHDTPPQDLTPSIIQSLYTLSAYPAFLLITLSDIMATQWPAIDPIRIEQRRQFVEEALQKHFS